MGELEVGAGVEWAVGAGGFGRAEDEEGVDLVGAGEVEGEGGVGGEVEIGEVGERGLAEGEGAGVDARAAGVLVRGGEGERAGAGFGEVAGAGEEAVEGEGVGSGRGCRVCRRRG